jgi:hypothetical protein
MGIERDPNATGEVTLAVKPADGEISLASRT